MDNFFSYHGEAREHARVIVHGLRKAGIPVWFDVDSTVPGLSVSHQLQSALRNAAGIFVLVDRPTPERWAAMELEVGYQRIAQDPAFPLVSILMPGVTPQSLESFQRTRTVISIPGPIISIPKTWYASISRQLSEAAERSEKQPPRVRYQPATPWNLHSGDQFLGRAWALEPRVLIANAAAVQELISGHESGPIFVSPEGASAPTRIHRALSFGPKGCLAMVEVPRGEELSHCLRAEDGPAGSGRELATWASGETLSRCSMSVQPVAGNAEFLRILANKEVLIDPSAPLFDETGCVRAVALNSEYACRPSTLRRILPGV